MVIGTRDGRRERRGKVGLNRHRIRPSAATALPDRLRRARAAKGWAQWEVAERLGIDQSQICHWEVGSAEPRLGVIPGLCRLLGVTADWLLGMEIDEQAPA